jgi:hypothetical protein
LSNDSLTQFERSIPGSLTSYTPQYVRPCPNAERSAKVDERENVNLLKS